MRNVAARRLAERCILAALPTLSDEAALQIHDLLHHVMDLFDARYGDQIDRFYEELCYEDLEQARDCEPDDPPF